ncbi:MAG TPA: hypothetical protein VH141_22120 [Pseudonocardia sp.]|jgi:hypothetical protein|nr:hypothetical protein [Pseudonocardia sp.]
MRRAWLAALVLFGAATLVAGCAGPPNLDPVPATSADGRGAVRPLPAPTGCTVTATDSDSLTRAMASAAPGQRICVLGPIGATRLILRRSGTEEQPIEVVGDGHTIVRGITVEASYVTVDGINSVHGWAPGIELTGDNITLRNSTSISPRGDDVDGLRFFGSNLRIVHNTIRDTLNLNLAHADCMQNYATGPDSPASQHVVITDNRCEQIDNQCLIAEGPNSSAGDGSGEGESGDFEFRNNYCDSHASQAVQLDDIQHATFEHNDIASPQDKAFSFQNLSTDGVVADNQLNPGIGYEVGMDESSRPGYRGPEPGGKP